MENGAHKVDWELLWSLEARKKQLPSLHGIVSRYTKEPDVIGMHGGLPPSSTFPFTWFHAGLLELSGSSAQPDSEQNKSCGRGGLSLKIDDPLAVATAQQYNMHAQGYAPLTAWARDMIVSLHKPATLQPQQNQEPIGMEVVITPGASAALDSLVRVLVNPGDAVLVEEYTYAHMVEAHLLPLGCELLPVQLDFRGLVPAHLDAVLTARAAAGKALPKLLYTIPTGQNPTGSVMDADRMGQVYALARKWDLIIIEDDAYFWLQYPDGPDNVPGLNLRPGFLSLDVDGRVVRVDTLAKLLGPGFRLGWLSGPPPLVAKLGLYMAGISIGANMVSQVMLHELLVKSWGRVGFEAFVKRLQAQYARQAAVAAAAAEQQLAGLAEWRPACAGMFMWMKLTGDADSESLVESAAAAKVMIVPGHLISVAHLQAAHKRKQQQQAHQSKLGRVENPQQYAQEQVQQHQAQAQRQQEQRHEQTSGLSCLLKQLQQQLTCLASAEQTRSCDDGLSGCCDSNNSSSSLANIASELSLISMQLQQLTPVVSHPSQVLPAASPTASPSAAVCSADGNPSSAELVLGAGEVAAMSPAATEQPELDTGMPVHCPFFRVSFVSVPAEAIEQGFVRLRAAILSCHGPHTPPGEETEVGSCSSIGSSVSAAADEIKCTLSAAGVVGAAVHVGGDSALC